MKTIYTLFTKRSRNIFEALLLVINLLFSNWLCSQQTMSLGNLRFVLPDETATMDSRTIRMKMAKGINSSLNFNLVGGVAFTQQAIPDFKVRKMDVYYSSEDSKAHLKINRKDIVIPLEMFELQPIVNFADSEDEVVVTLFGTSYGTINNQKSQQILFHPAFIDNIMGLRLLQVDAMTMLGGRNGEFPIFEKDSYCLTKSEREKYELLYKQLESRGSSYSNNAIEAYLQIKSIIGGSGTNSYIYTDIDEPIHFSIVNDSVMFSGMPYYQFNNRVENEINPLFCYYNITKTDRVKLASYIESLSKLTTLVLIWQRIYPDYSTSNILSILQNMDNLTYSQREMFKSEVEKHYYYYSTSQLILVAYYKCFNVFTKLDNQPGKTDEQKAHEFVQRIQEKQKDLDPELAQAIQSALAIEFPMCAVNVETTNNLRERPELVRQLNPIVYQEVDDICQWGALFRYIKANYPSAWQKFVKQVNEIKSDAPTVKTPIYRIQ